MWLLLLECGYYRIYWTCSKKQLNDAVVSWPQKIIKIAGGDNFWLLTIIIPPHRPFAVNRLWLWQHSSCVLKGFCRNLLNSKASIRLQYSILNTRVRAEELSGSVCMHMFKWHTQQSHSSPPTLLWHHF